MPIATQDQYLDMIARAKAGAFAYPAINVTSSPTAEAHSGITAMKHE